MQSNTAASTVNIPKSRWSCSWTYRINKLLMNPNERFNNIILQRTIKNHGRFPSDKTRWVSSVACGSFVAEGERIEITPSTCSFVTVFAPAVITYFPIKGIDECQQQWFLTARFSNRKKRTKFTTYTTFSLHRILRTIAKLDPRLFPVILQDPPNEKRRQKIWRISTQIRIRKVFFLRRTQLAFYHG